MCEEAIDHLILIPIIRGRGGWFEKSLIRFEERGWMA